MTETNTSAPLLVSKATVAKLNEKLSKRLEELKENEKRTPSELDTFNPLKVTISKSISSKYPSVYKQRKYHYPTCGGSPAMLVNVIVPISGTYTSKEKRVVIHRMCAATLKRDMSGLYKLAKIAEEHKNACRGKYITIVEPENLSIFLTSSIVNVRTSGSGDVVQLYPWYCLSAFFRTNRVQEFAKNVAYGGNAVLRPKSDTLLWENILGKTRRDPDKVTIEELAHFDMSGMVCFACVKHTVVPNGERLVVFTAGRELETLNRVLS